MSIGQQDVVRRSRRQGGRRRRAIAVAWSMVRWMVLGSVNVGWEVGVHGSCMVASVDEMKVSSCFLWPCMAL